MFGLPSPRTPLRSLTTRTMRPYAFPRKTDGVLNQLLKNPRQRDNLRPCGISSHAASPTDDNLRPCGEPCQLGQFPTMRKSLPASLAMRKSLPQTKNHAVKQTHWHLGVSVSNSVTGPPVDRDVDGQSLPPSESPCHQTVFITTLSTVHC